MSTAIEGLRRLVLNTMCTKTFADVCAIFLRPVGAGPRFAHASPRLTPWALFLRRFAAAPDRFLKNAAVRLFALAVENTSCLLPKCFVLAVENTSCLLPKCFALAVENTSLLMSKYFAVAAEILRPCYRDTSRLVASLNYPVGDDRPETS
jgi:hypothetical protein